MRFATRLVRTRAFVYFWCNWRRMKYFAQDTTLSFTIVYSAMQYIPFRVSYCDCYLLNLCLTTGERSRSNYFRLRVFVIITLTAVTVSKLKPVFMYALFIVRRSCIYSRRITDDVVLRTMPTNNEGYFHLVARVGRPTIKHSWELLSSPSKFAFYRVYFVSALVFIFIANFILVTLFYLWLCVMHKIQDKIFLSIAECFNIFY